MARRAPLARRVMAAFAVLTLTAATAAAQAVISGRVSSGTGPLEGATITLPSVPGAQARTGPDGTYRLVATLPDGQPVVVLARALGYRPLRQTVTIASRAGTANFALDRDVLNLDQMVVTGTSDAISTRKTAFSVGVVDGAQLREAPATSPLGGLNGRVAGATVTATTGSPGSAPAIRLRGATSLTGRSDPLVIIDGTITRLSLADINAEDIDRIEVIKGAAASSLYGSDAANGVVQIFTKSGRQLVDGRTEVLYRTEYGSNSIRRSIPNNTSHPFQLTAGGDFFLDGDGNRVLEDDLISDNPYPQLFDQLGQVYRPSTFATNYISVGQRRGSSSFNASFQSTRDQGVLNLLDGFQRQNFRINTTTAINDRIDLQTGAFFGTSFADQPDEGNVFFGLRMLEPNVDLSATVDGIAYNPKVRQSGRTGNVSNPLYSAFNQQNEVERDRFTGYARATFRIRDWLTAEGNMNYDMGDERQKNFVPIGFLTSTGQAGEGSLFQAERETRAYNLGAALTSVRQFGNITNTTKLAWVYEDQNNRQLTVSAPALALPRVPEFGAAKRDPTTPVTPGSFTQDIRNNNVFLISTFDYDDKLILDGLIRQDQSSLFGVDQRSAIYYRGSAAYRVSEDYTLPGIQEFKLRGSVGTAGLRPVYDAQYEQFALIGGIPVKRTLGNPDLRPAQSREVELGFNLEFLDRFSFEYSYSDKLTTDQIMLVPVSAAQGYENQWLNAGSLKANTHEALFGAVLAQRQNFFWRLNVTIDRTRQTVDRLNVAPFLVGPDQGDGNTAIFRIAEGETFGVIYGSRWIRTRQQLETTLAAGGLEGSVDDYVRNEEGYYVEEATWRTADERPLRYTNAQGQQVMQIGDVNPDFNMAFNSQISWRGLTVTAVVNWVKGGDIYNYTRQWPFFDLRDPAIDQRNKPEIERKNVNYYSEFYNRFDPSDYFVEDGSYLRLRELAVNYELPNTLVDRAGLGARSVRVGLVGRNLLTLTNYSGYDPDVSGPGGGNPFAYRVDYFTYPVFRTLTAMVEIGF